MNTYNGFTESEERIANRKERILASYSAPLAAVKIDGTTQPTFDSLHAEAMTAVKDLRRLARKMRHDEFIGFIVALLGYATLAALAGYVAFAVITAWLIVR